MRRVLLPQHISDQAAPPGAAIRDLRGLTMGTSWSVRLLESAMPGRAGSVDLQQGLQQQLDIVVAQMSHWSEESDLGRFNRAEPGSWHSLPAAFCEVLGFAMHVAQASGGAYDPCAGALVNLWGFGPRHRYDEPGFLPPKDDSVALLLAQRQRRRLELDLPARRARQPGGLQLDLSAIAKGYGVDRLARYLDSQGIHHYLVEVGGELRARGRRPDGQPWRVAVAGTAREGAPPRTLVLQDMAIATSGDHWHAFDQGGRRYSHTLDPRTGAPVAHALASVTVLHAECMQADALATVLTVLGPREGLAFATSRGVAALLCERTAQGLSMAMTPAFETLTS